MGKSNFRDILISEKFRTPLSVEREIGLWIDRIGIEHAAYAPAKLRILGLYAAVCIESGSGFYYSESSGEIPVTAGDTMIIFPDIPHKYYPAQKWTTSYVVWSGAEALMLERLGYLSRDSIVIPGSFDIVVEANHALLEIIDSEDLNAILHRKSIALDMILKLHQRRQVGNKLQKRAVLIEKVLRYMHINYTKNIAVSEYAGYANLSETHFRRLFKAHTGRSPKEFLLALRISKAKELLSQGLSIKETALKVGWDDEFYFMRIFKKISGFTPGKFMQ